MTTSSEYGTYPSEPAESQFSEELLKARDRTAQQRARATRALDRGRARRRFLPSVIVGSALLVTAGFADRFVQSSIPSATVATTTPLSVPVASNSPALIQVTQTLAADQRAIAAIAKAQAQLAASAGGDGGGQVAISNVQLPTLPTLPSISNVSIPAATTAPATHATTGASVVVP